mgnify:CR=1 FL=1
MIHQVNFDKVELLTTDEKNTIIYHYANKTASIDELSRTLGIDRLIIRKFISDYKKGFTDK